MTGSLEMVCRLSGQIAGDTAVHWAVREGSRTILEEKLATHPDGIIDVTATFRCEGDSPASILVGFEGEAGILRAPKVSWSPCSTELIEKSGLSFKGDQVGFSADDESRAPSSSARPSWCDNRVT